MHQIGQCFFMHMFRLSVFRYTFVGFNYIFGPGGFKLLKAVQHMLELWLGFTHTAGVYSHFVTH